MRGSQRKSVEIAPWQERLIKQMLAMPGATIRVKLAQPKDKVVFIPKPKEQR